MPEGFFITFEGTEGTGKSTQVPLLAEALRRDGRKVVTTREPGGTKLGESLRSVLLGLKYSDLSQMAELFLYMADRSQHLAEVIGPALDRGDVVICDRFSDASLAYQGYGRGLDRGLIRKVNAEATGGRGPDLTLLLDFEDVRDGIERAVGRHRKEGTDGTEDRFEREDLDFHQRVRRGYHELAASEPERFRIVPADLSPNEVHAQLLEHVRAFLPPLQNR